MLKSYLKQDRLITRLLRKPISLLRRARSRPLGELYSSYDACVKGGEVRLQSSNLKGNFTVQARSDCARRIILHGLYEPETTDLIGKYLPNQLDAVNVGANVGFFVIHMALSNPGIRVLAVEPNREAFTLLQRNILANEISNRVVAINACASAENGFVEFASIPEKPEYSSISEIAHVGTSGIETIKYQVGARPLDSMVDEHGIKPGLIVMDTEGAELLVLLGAGRILRSFRPIIIFECSHTMLSKFGHSSKQAEDMLISHGYTVRNANAPRRKLSHPFEGEAVALWSSSDKV